MNYAGATGKRLPRRNRPSVMSIDENGRLVFDICNLRYPESTEGVHRTERQALIPSATTEPGRRNLRAIPQYRPAETNLVTHRPCVKT